MNCEFKGEIMDYIANFSFSLQLISYAFLSAILIIGSVKDVLGKNISDKFIILSFASGFVLVLLTLNITLIIEALLGSIAAGVILWFISYITKGGISAGDIKIFVCVGIYLGLQQTLSALFISSVLCGLFGIFLMISRLSKRKNTIPFIPFIFAGSLLTVLLS